MARSRVTFIICLVLSAGLHAALLLGLKRWADAHPVRIAQEPVVRWVPAPIERRPPPPEFGEATGAGQAINSSQSDDVQTALKSTEDQAALTRDPTGAGPSAMASSAAPPPKAEALPDPVFAPPPAAAPFFPKSAAPAPHKIAPPAPPAAEPNPQPDPPAKPTQQPAKPQPPAPQPPRPQPPTPQPPTPQPPTPQAPSEQPPQRPSDGGKPMQHSDRDSDLFAKEAGMEFKNGRVSSRTGRVVKFARPRENLAAIMDTAAIEFPAIIKMSITIDATGHPRNVVILHGTGSGSIDRVFELATYSSWFEPPKDAAGRPQPDAFVFSIVLN